MTENKTSATIPEGRLEYLRLEYGSIENLPDVMTVMERAFSKTYGESWNNNQCRSMLSLPGTRLLLTWLDGKLLGFAICRAVADEEELLMIAVDPQYRNLGIAALLLKKITERAEAANIAVIFLEVRSNNPAQSIYKRHGFKKIGRRADYYTGANKVKYDAITYRKLLKRNH